MVSPPKNSPSFLGNMLAFLVVIVAVGLVLKQYAEQ